MSYFVGLDASLRSVSVCVIDGGGQFQIWDEGRFCSV